MLASSTASFPRTRDHVHTAAVALDQATQARCLLVTYSVRAQGLVFPAQSELREEPVLICISGGRPINAQLDRSDDLVRMLCQVGAVIGAREASERVGSSGSRHRKDQQDSSERDPVHFSLPLF